MGIFLTILKILGIVLASIVGLLLLIILLVLFVPVTYKVSGEYGDKIGGRVKVGWLFASATGNIKKTDDGMDGIAKLKVFGIPIKKIRLMGHDDTEDKHKVKPKKEKKNKKSGTGKAPDERTETGNSQMSDLENDLVNSPVNRLKNNTENSSENGSVNATNDADSQNSRDHNFGEFVSGISGVAGAGGSNINNIITGAADTNGINSNVGVGETGGKADSINGNESFDIDGESDINKEIDRIFGTGEETPEEDKAADEDSEKGKVGIIEKLRLKALKILEKISGTKDKVLDKKDTLIRKKDHFIEFLDKPYTKNTIARGKKLLKKVFKNLLPRKGNANVLFGLKTPEKTGAMLGNVCMFYPLYHKWLHITPEFYEKKIEADLWFKGRIFIGSMAIPALFLVLSKDFKRTRNLAKKI